MCYLNYYNDSFYTVNIIHFTIDIYAGQVIFEGIVLREGNVRGVGEEQFPEECAM